MRELRVILADDHASMRAAIRSVLNSVEGVIVVGEATTGQEALELIEAQLPDIALLDMRLGTMTGMEVATRALKHAPDTATILLAMESEAPAGWRLPEGISGIVAKEAAVTELPEALAAVARGERFMSRVLAGDRKDGRLPERRTKAAWVTD